MKKNRDDLVKEVSLFIKCDIIDKRLNKEIIETACVALKNHFKPIKLSRILSLNEPIKMLSDTELCNLTMYLKDFVGMKIDIEEWFFKEEVDAAREDIIDTGIVDDGKIVFKDVIFNGDYDNPVYRCFATYKEIGDINSRSKLSYNTSAQRIGTVVSRGETTAIIPSLEDKAILNIAKLVAKEKFKSNDIILNIPKKDDTKRYYYDSENKTLTINDELDITDGAHRNYGIIEGLKMNPNAKGSIGVTIMNMTIEEAGNLVYQVSQTNEHNRELIEKYNEENVVSQFIKKLNTSFSEEDNFLYQKIDFNANNEYNAPIIKFETLYSVMNSNDMVSYISKAGINVRKRLLEFVIDFYTSLTESLKEKGFSSMLQSNNFLCGLMYTAFELYRNTRGSVKLSTIEEIANNFDFEKVDYLFKNTKLNYEIKKDMKNIFTEVLKNIE